MLLSLLQEVDPDTLTSEEHPNMTSTGNQDINYNIAITTCTGKS